MNTTSHTPPAAPDPTDGSTNWQEQSILITWNKDLTETVDLHGADLAGATVSATAIWNQGLVPGDVMQIRPVARIVPNDLHSVYELQYEAAEPAGPATAGHRRIGKARITFQSGEFLTAVWTDENGAVSHALNATVVDKPVPATTFATVVKIRNKLSLTAFLASLDCRLRIGFYWSAASDSQQRVIVTVWDDQIVNGQYTLLPKENLPWKYLPGAYELRRHIPLALKTDAEVFGVICHALNDTAGTRKRQYYNELELVKLQIREVDGAWIAQIGELAPVQQIRDGVPLLPTPGDALNDLDIPTGQPHPGLTSTAGGTRYMRDAMVRDYVVSRAEGRCEYCRAKAFTKENGKPYLEGHHVEGLAAGGPDTVDNVIALCANDHREAHYGQRRAELNEDMLRIIRQRNAPQ